MPRLVISTVGTSLLTNQIRERTDPKGSSRRISETANLTYEEVSQYYEDVLDIINTLEERAVSQLYENGAEVAQIREASAELNGIYGLYENQLDKGKLDHHCLVTTDTAQGQVTAKIVKDFLKPYVNFVEIYTPENLSTASTENFSQGIDDLIDWIHKKVKDFENTKYEICFNLVGGFKAFQGCMNTIGMFYAHKIIYVFEGKESNLITIPRLPITVDHSRLKDHVVTIALLDAGAALSLAQIDKVPEAMVREISGKMTISNWGELVWNQCKDDFLSKDLQIFPRIHYEDSFRKDYHNINNKQEKVKLQETLAKISCLLEESNGDTRGLAKAVSYYTYQGTKDKKGVDHFYVGIHIRVSCKAMSGKLSLRYYGTHDYVEGKELK